METKDTMELEQMRQQMDTLKQKLNRQEIVNDRLMRSAMKEKSNKLSQSYIGIAIMGIVTILFFPDILARHGLSTALIITTEIIMAAAIGFSIYQKYLVGSTDMFSENLVETRKKIARSLKIDVAWPKYFTLPVAFPWLCWMLYEAYNLNSEFGSFLAGGMLVGAIIGGILGSMMVKKNIRLCKEILAQIDDITATE